MKIHPNQLLLLGPCIHPFSPLYVTIYRTPQRKDFYICIYIFFFYFRRDDVASKGMRSFLFLALSHPSAVWNAPREKRYLGNVSERHCSIMALFCDWLAWRWRSWRLTITRGISDKSLFMYHHFITSISCLKSLSHLLSSVVSFFSPSYFPLWLSPLLHTLCRSRSRGHATQIDCSLIASVMMLRSAHLTCLINTTAATPALLLSPTLSRTLHPHKPPTVTLLGSSNHVLFSCIHPHLSPSPPPLHITPTPSGLFPPLCCNQKK